MNTSTSNVKAVPEGYHTLTPLLMVQGVDTLLDFLHRGFDATEKNRFTGPNGKIMHAEMQIGDSVLMIGEGSVLSDENEAPTTGSTYVYIDDVDRIYKQALSAGAKSIKAPENQFYGDRTASVKDPCGNMWFIATHIEDVSPSEMKRRVDKTPN